MKIKNSTPWNDNDLRKFFRKCVQEVEKVEKPSYKFKDRHSSFILEIMNTDWNIRGRATVNGYWIMVKIPKMWIEMPKIKAEKQMREKQKEDLAKLMIHEYYHTIGHKSQDRGNYKYDFTKNWNVSWVRDYLIREKVKVIKTKTDIKQKRYQQALQNLTKAKTRKKRADTLYKKWRDKVAYYERVYNFKS